MNRQLYYNYIEERLQTLASRIVTGGKLNMLSLNMHSESFYLHFFNLIYDYKLINLNDELQNVEAIDLIDHSNEIIFQVSATNTKTKLESTLKKEIFKNYPDYTFRFISIARDVADLKKATIGNPHSVKFDPNEDILDKTTVLSKVFNLGIDKQKEVYEFIKKELGQDVDILKFDSNLTTVINILSNEKWGDSNKIDSVNTFEIDRKIDFNNLDLVREIIEDNSLFYEKVDSKYTEFDSLGANKSNSVLATIKREYIKLSSKENADDIFFKFL
ncbi:ABC-three component system protein [Tenacibaculum maritimum]|uniref:ABC-three component system protein n=1 Tax=Tenacibaculum maritimum TaxID=107401 RepID=UPI00387660E2